MVPEKEEDVVATREEGPAPSTSRLGLGDLRHSLQVHRESQHHGQSKKERTGMEVPSGVSVAPKSRLGQQTKRKVLALPRGKGEVTSELEESMADSHIDREEIRCMQR